MAAISTIFWLAVYVVIFTPLAVLYRLIRPDPLAIRRQPSAASYWRTRRGQQYTRMTSKY